MVTQHDEGKSWGWTRAEGRVRPLGSVDDHSWSGTRAEGRVPTEWSRSMTRGIAGAGLEPEAESGLWGVPTTIAGAGLEPATPAL